MATQNLFGQYFTTKANKADNKYQVYEYICSNADDGTNNAVIIDDGKVELIDVNGNNIASLDLSQIKAQPVTEHNEGSFILKPGEVNIINGLEVGKTFKKMFFIVPEVIPDSYLDEWRRFINVDFMIVYESGIESREFNIATVYHEETKEDIVERINFLFGKLGLSEYLYADIEEVMTVNGNPINYFTFTSLQEGFDFLVSDFKIHTIDYNYYFDVSSGERVYVDLDETRDGIVYGNTDVTDSSLPFDEEENEDNIYGISEVEGIVESEDNVVFPDGTTLKSEIGGGRYGYYDENESLIDFPSKRFHYGGFEDNQSVGMSEFAIYSGYQTSEGQLIFTIKGDDYFVERCRHLEIGAMKYPNKASRVWFIVPEYPTETDEQSVSILVNHVADKILSFVPVATKTVLPSDMDSSISDSSVFDECRDYLYEKRLVDVCIHLKDEKERRLLSFMKEYFRGQEFEFIDKNNGAISPVSYDLGNECGCCVRTNRKNPHTGLYGYLDHVFMQDKWTKVGQMYGLITEEEKEECLSKNLANSVVLFNPNEFPVKINFFTAI